MLELRCDGGGDEVATLPVEEGAAMVSFVVAVEGAQAAVGTLVVQEAGKAAKEDAEEVEAACILPLWWFLGGY